MELAKQIDQKSLWIGLSHRYWTYNPFVKQVQVLNGDLHTASRQKMWSWSCDVEILG